MTPPQSVRTRFLRITAPLIFASVMGVLGVIEYKTYRNKMAELQSPVALMMRTQAASLVMPMWNLDTTQIRLTLAAIVANSEVLTASAFDETGTFIAHAGRADATDPTARIHCTDVLRGPVDTARQIGALEVVVTARDIWQKTRNRIILDMAIALLAVLMEVGAALFALRQIVGVSLSRLMDAITAEKAGGIRDPIPIGTMDEMGQVIASFNEMLQ
ncbi:MAG: hypothetical protein NXH97_00070 [Rhodobacteraceae bacterium]|nr:hypothetical protein [Paracoccaceae bacterium]